MEVATRKALELVDKFSDDPEERESVRIYLSEAPIGDEYGYLTQSGWDIGVKYEKWLAARGVAVFEEPYGD